MALTAKGLQPQEIVRFEIDIPGAKPFIGASHTAGADGTVTANYRTAGGNPPGTYSVKVTGDKGSSATGAFTVTPGSSPTTAKPKTSGSSTTAPRTTTTTRSTSSTTAKPSSATTTTAKATTTTAHA